MRRAGSVGLRLFLSASPWRMAVTALLEVLMGVPAQVE